MFDFTAIIHFVCIFVKLWCSRTCIIERDGIVMILPYSVDKLSYKASDKR